MVRTSVKKLYRSPTLHFIVLGLFAFLMLNERFAAPEVLVIDREIVQQTIRDWETLQQGPITPQQERLLAEQMARSAVLVKVAHDAGLDRTAAVDQRLLNLARFLGLVDPGVGDRQAIEAARELDLHHTDTVVRRYLETAAEFLLAEQVEEAAISEEMIAGYYRRHADEFRIPRRIRLSHLFIADSSGAEARALQLSEQIRHNQLEPSAAIRLGDPFYGGHHIGFKTQRQLAATLGTAFADAAWRLPVGEWSAPIRSAYGMHLVFVEEAVAERLPPLETVRADIVARLERQHRGQMVDRRIADLRERYHIVGVDLDFDVDTGADAGAGESRGNT